MKNNHASDWQPGTLKTPSEYSRRAFYALSRHFLSTFWIPKQNEYYRGVLKVLARCTSSLDLHMLIVPYWYLFRTLLVPKVALGYSTVSCHNSLRHWSQRRPRQALIQCGTCFPLIIVTFHQSLILPQGMVSHSLTIFLLNMCGCSFTLSQKQRYKQVEQ